MRLSATILALTLMAAPLTAEWGWYRGDITTFPASNTGSGISEQIHRAIEAGLDWVALSTTPGTGSFIGQNELIAEIGLTMPRLTPILATGWLQNGVGIRVLGIDARAPIPKSLADLLSTASSHRGLVVLSEAGDLDLSTSGIEVFSPLRDGRWVDVEAGGAWDAALQSGRRLFVTTASQSIAGSPPHHTTVWADGNAPDQIIRALRAGSCFVSDRESPHLDMQVDGKTFGQTVFHEGEPFVRIRVYGEDPIASVSLIADGVEIWSAQPEQTIWEERFFLPAYECGYVRAILTSESGKQTIGNPIFLVAEQGGDGELPIVHDPRLPQDDLIEVGGIVEALEGLAPETQKRVLREFLADPSTRYGATWLLQNRGDVVTDSILRNVGLEDVNPDARLGATYALVTRGSPVAPDLLLDLLNDPTPSVRVYAARIFAHYTEGFAESDWPWSSEQDDETSGYLVRAYRPVRYAKEDVARILSALESRHPILFSSASDKLVDLGTRHYRVIEDLIRATEGGSSRAADILRVIGDHRTVSDLQRIFASLSDPTLRRSIFLALSDMGAPHPDRPAVEVPQLTAPPTLDGTLTPQEWADAATFEPLKLDWDGSQVAPSPRILIGHRGDTLYVAISHQTTSGIDATLSDTPGGTRQDTRFEISLASPPFAPSTAKVVSVTPFGLLTESDSGECRVSSRVTVLAWELELAVPLDTSYARMNVAFFSNSRAKRATWSVTYGEPQDPKRFGNLTLSRP